jgi:hypothetical protein
LGFDLGILVMCVVSEFVIIRDYNVRLEVVYVNSFSRKETPLVFFAIDTIPNESVFSVFDE